MNNSTGLMLVICAPSGTGKSTLIHRLINEFPNFTFSISCTTRQPRPGEIHGQDYSFLTQDEFLARREAGFFAEWAEVHGNLYGTPRQATEEILAAGRDLLFDIDVQGARQVRASMHQGCFVFLFPPSKAELTRRLTNRGTETEASVAKRLAGAQHEIAASHDFDHWIVNTDVDTAYDQLRAIYLAEKTRPRYNAAWAQRVRDEWEVA